jgi:NAD+ kinase
MKPPRKASIPPRVLVLAKRTSYRTMVLEEKDARVKRLIARSDPTVKRLRRSHEQHEETRREVMQALQELRAAAELVDGPRSVVTGAFDLVVTVGGDGTLLAASHRMGPHVPILGVNSAPDHSVGFFCVARKGGVRAMLAAALAGELRRTVLTRMRVDLNGQCLHNRVLNDALFCHTIPAATSRYILEIKSPAEKVEIEEQRSSGLWIGPAAGSTAAQRSAGGRVLKLTSKKIQWVVREPYTPGGVPLRLPVGTVDEGGHIQIRNKMREAKIFLDGHHIVHDVQMGDVITLRRSDETLMVLGLTRDGGGKAWQG